MDEHFNDVTVGPTGWMNLTCLIRPTGWTNRWRNGRFKNKLDYIPFFTGYRIHPDIKFNRIPDNIGYLFVPDTG